MLAWLLCLVPRGLAVAFDWPNVNLDTSSTLFVDGVLTTDLHTPIWSPLYEAFAAAAWWVSVGSTAAFVALHIAVAALVGPAVFALAVRLGLEARTAWFAVAGCACLPYLVAASVRQIDVGVDVAVAAVAAATLARPSRLSGVSACLWFLSRANAVVALAGMFVWAAAGWSERGTRARTPALQALAVFGLLMLFWSVSNAVRFGRFTPLPANAGLNLYLGNRAGVGAALASRAFNPALEPAEPDVPVDPPTAYGADAAMQRKVWAVMRAHPMETLALVPPKFARYWDWRLGTDRPHSSMEQWAYTAPYVAMLLLAGAGAVMLWRSGRRRALGFLVIVIVGFMLPHLIVFGLTRMRMTVEWALVLLAAVPLGSRMVRPE